MNWSASNSIIQFIDVKLTGMPVTKVQGMTITSKHYFRYVLNKDTKKCEICANNCESCSSNGAGQCDKNRCDDGYAWYEDEATSKALCKGGLNTPKFAIFGHISLKSIWYKKRSLHLHFFLLHHIKHFLPSKDIEYIA